MLRLDHRIFEERKCHPFLLFEPSFLLLFFSYFIRFPTKMFYLSVARAQFWRVKDSTAYLASVSWELIRRSAGH
jgi:hypothetical protein